MTELRLESECSLVEAGVNLSWGFTRNIILNVNDIEEFRKKHNNTGIYVTAYRYSEENQDNAYVYGDLYLDYDLNDLANGEDQEESFQKLREDALKTLTLLSAIFGINKEEVKIYFSGKKGLHLVVPGKTLGLRPDKELNEIFRLIAKDIHKYIKHKTIDLRIYDKKRLFRLPGSIHQATGMYKIPLSYDELLFLTYEQIASLAKAPRQIEYAEPKYNPKAYRILQDFYRQWEQEKQTRNLSAKRQTSGVLRYTPPCITYMLENECAEGKRNNTATAIASHFRQRGFSEQEAFQKLGEWNTAFCSPALKDRELATIITSIFRGTYKYGCQTYKDLGECDIKACRLKR